MLLDFSNSVYNKHTWIVRLDRFKFQSVFLSNIPMRFSDFACRLTRMEFCIWLLYVSLCLYHLRGCYIWKSGGVTVDLLLISGPEIGSSRFPWLLRIWQPFFPWSSTRGMLTSVFLVTLRGNLGSEEGLCILMCGMRFVHVFITPAVSHNGTNTTTKL